MMPTAVNKGVYQQGLTLIEVLVSVLVLAIGLLGLAGLQSFSLRANQDSYYRTQAMMAVDDYIDRMRANQAAADVGSYTFNSPSGAAPVDCEDSAVTCSSNQLAAFDAAQWEAEVQRVLPSSTISVNRNAATGIYSIAIVWDEMRAGADYVAPTCAVEADNGTLGCFFTTVGI